jgi:nitrogenase molybdenum-iron protein alpha/beta subunit
MTWAHLSPRLSNEGHIPEDLPVPYAHTPSFVGSHITGYDNMLKSILTTLTKDQESRNHQRQVQLQPGL